ncbi:S41 family peptidase [Pedobacter lusitanus]
MRKKCVTQRISKFRGIYFLNVLLIVLVPMLISCRKKLDEQMSPSNVSDDNFKTIFDGFWNGMNRNYVMWDIDTTRWDNIYSIFSPVFSKLQIKNRADRLLAAHYLRQMTRGLRDGHYSLQFNDPVLKDSSIIPADIRLKLRPDYHLSYQSDYFDQIAKRYLDKPYYDADYNTDLQHPLRYKAGTIRQNILYFRLNSFSIFRAFNSENGRMTALLDFVFRSIKDHNTKGVILDLRDNNGGDLQDLNFFAGRFIARPLQYGSSRYKSSNNPFDYTLWMPAIITPMPESQEFKNKIVVLVNMYSISMSELITMALKALPNTTVIGERTYGANGLLTAEADLNGGSFNVGDFAVIKAASAMFKYKDDHVYEGVGFPADIQVPYDESMALIYTDRQLEKAISLFEP